MFDPALSRKRGGADTEDQPRSLSETNMNVNPLDLRQQRFRNAFRGFDKIEVTSFLMAAAGGYEEALRGTHPRPRDPAQPEGGRQEHPDHQQSPTNTSFAAQQLA